jgi:hypothetical protein
MILETRLSQILHSFSCINPNRADLSTETAGGAEKETIVHPCFDSPLETRESNSPSPQHPISSKRRTYRVVSGAIEKTISTTDTIKKI